MGQWWTYKRVSHGRQTTFDTKSGTGGIPSETPTQTALAVGRPFDSRSVYYDDACRCVETQMKLYNRVVPYYPGFVRQIRSSPSTPPRKSSGKQDGFEAAIKLVYDGDMVIEYGKPPSFCRVLGELQFKKPMRNSVMIGQEEIWETKEAEKECARIDRSWRESRNTRRPTHFRPYGNSGPGVSWPICIRSKPRSKKMHFHLDEGQDEGQIRRPDQNQKSPSLWISSSMLRPTSRAIIKKFF